MSDRATPTLPSRDLAATATFYARPGFQVAFRVADARGLHDAFGAAGLPAAPGAIPRPTPPVDQRWGFRELSLLDADGNLLRDLEPLGPERRGGRDASP